MTHAPTPSLQAAHMDDLDSINRVIENCVHRRPVSPRINKLTLPSLLLDATDLDFMEVWVSGNPIVGVLSLQAIDEGLLIHGLYVEPGVSRQGIGHFLIQHARQRANACAKHRLIVKAFPEAVGFFNSAGFEASDVIDYPYTLEMKV